MREASKAASASEEAAKREEANKREAEEAQKRETEEEQRRKAEEKAAKPPKTQQEAKEPKVGQKFAVVKRSYGVAYSSAIGLKHSINRDTLKGGRLAWAGKPDHFGPLVAAIDAVEEKLRDADFFQNLIDNDDEEMIKVAKKSKTLPELHEQHAQVL